MICEKCSFNIADDFEICPNCGNVVKRPVAMPPQQNQPRKFWKTGPASGLGTFFTILLAILLLFTSSLSILITNLRYAISSNGMEAFLDSIPFEELTDDFNFEAELSQFEDILYKEHGATLSDESLTNFLEKSTFNAFFAKEFENIFKGILAGERPSFTFNSKIFYELLLENKKLLSSEFNIPELTDKQLYDLSIEVFGEKEISVFSYDEISNDTSLFFDILKFALSNLYIILISVSLLIILVMIKINVFKGINTTGTIFIITSSIYLLIKFALVPIVLFAFGSEMQEPEFTHTLSNLLNTLFTPSTIISVVLLVGSIGLLIFSKIKKAKIKKAAGYR